MIFDVIARRAALTPQRKAVWFNGRWYSYSELDRRAERLAAGLAARGVVKGDRVSILALNHLAHLDLIAATAKLGFVYAPLNYRLPAREGAQIVRYLKPRLLLYDESNAEVALALQRALGVETLPLARYEGWLEASSGAFADPELNEEDSQMILLTGGSTGLPKGAMQPYRQGFYNAVNTVFSWGLRDDDCVVQATPAFHAAVNALTVPLLHLGGRVVLTLSFEPGAYLELVCEHRCTLLFMVPTMYKRLADHPDFKESDLSSVRWAISGGAPCPGPVREAFAAKGVAFKQGYGLTEAGVNCFAIDVGEAKGRPESVGKPVLHAEAVIRHKDGEPVRQGEVGELTLRGPHLFKGYFERPEETREALREGWLWTGDLAKEDAGGFFYIAGRRKDMFISGGENVFPAEVEGVLYEHPAVCECAVLGVPHATWGEVGLVAVVLHPGMAASAEELTTFLRERLAPYKVPKHLRFVDDLPKSGAGKILKRVLAERFERTLGGTP